MGKTMNFLISAAVVLIGLLGLISWRNDLFTVMKGTLPLLLVIGGAIGVVASFSELKDMAKGKK